MMYQRTLMSRPKLKATWQAILPRADSSTHRAPEHDMHSDNLRANAEHVEKIKALEEKRRKPAECDTRCSVCPPRLSSADPDRRRSTIETNCGTQPLSPRRRKCAQRQSVFTDDSHVTTCRECQASLHSNCLRPHWASQHRGERFHSSDEEDGKVLHLATEISRKPIEDGSSS